MTRVERSETLGFSTHPAVVCVVDLALQMKFVDNKRNIEPAISFNYKADAIQGYCAVGVYTFSNVSINCT